MSALEFKQEYNEAREKFHELYEALSVKYNCEITSYKVGDDYYIDQIEIIPAQKENLICITTGLHGIEGYVGNYILQRFVQQHMDKINTENTGIILVHGINPFGMAKKRKVNENNVDLNRNFLDFRKIIEPNESYIKNERYYLPSKLPSSKWAANSQFALKTVSLFINNTIEKIKEGALRGQYRYSEGFYYGGNKHEISTSYILGLFERVFTESYKTIIEIDIHTGYGPKNQMSIVNSPYESRCSEYLVEAFNYPLIQVASGDEFYEIKGDMVEYLDEKYKKNTLDKVYFGTCFEFGTIGDDMISELKSLRAMIHENSVYAYHAEGEYIAKSVQEDFRQLYMPSNDEWLQKVVKDFDKGLQGIMTYYKIYRQ